MNDNFLKIGKTYTDTLGFKYEVISKENGLFKCKKLETNEVFYYNRYGIQISLLGSLSELLPNEE